MVLVCVGVDESLPQGLHFSRITNGVDPANAAALLGLSVTDVANGLAAAVNGDATGRFHATTTGSTVTITGPAFSAGVTAGLGTATIDTVNSVKAYQGTLKLQLSTSNPAVDLATGAIWQLTLNGIDFGYGVQPGDQLPDIAQKLADRINAAKLFSATVDLANSTITITPPSTLPAYTVFSTGKGTVTPVAGHFTPSD